MAGSRSVSKLAQLRLDKGLTLEEVAELTNMHPSTIGKWEYGKVELGLAKTRLTNEQIELFCKLFDITPKQLDSLIKEAYTQRDNRINYTASTKPVVEDPEGKIIITPTKIYTKNAPKKPKTAVAKKTVSTVDIAKYEALLSRLYNKVSYEDFMTISEMVNKLKE